MAGSKGNLRLRWALTGLIVMLLGAMVGLSISLMQASPPFTQGTVVKSVPPLPPPEKPLFLGAEEEGVNTMHQAQNEALGSMTGEGVGQRPPQLIMPEILDSEADSARAALEQAEKPAEQLAEGQPQQEGSGGGPESPPGAAEAALPASSTPEKAASTDQAAVSEPLEPPSAGSEQVSPAEASAFAYTIHLESFRNPRIAEKRKEQIEGMGLEAFIVKVDLPEKGIFHRVFVGRFPDRTQAAALQARLKKDYDLPEGRIMAASKIDH
jgi:cell division septation protein DedD